MGHNTMKWKLSTSRHKVSSWRELWSGEWSQQPRLRDLSLWAGPPQRPSPQFWLGVKYRAPCLGQKVPPDGELQRRLVEKGYYIWEPYPAGHRGAMRSSRTRSGELSPGLPGAERSAPVSTGCLLLYCGPPKYNSPKGITLDAAAIRPNSLWNCLTVSDWPSLILFTADRMESICAGDRRGCIDVESHASPRKVVLCSRESTLFLAFSRNPNFFMWARTTSRCRTANWCDWAWINQSSM